MRRRRVPQEHTSHERWLVSYADFITLLFAFFVVLYASSQVDKKKISQVAAAIQGGFQQMGVFSGTRPGPIVSGSSAASSAVNASLPAPPTAGVTTPSQASARDPVQKPSGVDVELLKKQLESALNDEIKNHEVEMHVGPDGLVVSLREIGFFNSGDDSLLPDARPKLARIATVLGERRFQIRVEGHTDNVPIHNAKFKSNWELSTSRAMEVISMLTETHGFDPRQLSVAGYSEYRPVADNGTAEGRKANRRVDLVIVSGP